MRTLVVSNFLSVDGVMQGPGGPEEDRSGGFDRGGWIVNYWDDDLRELLGGWNSRSWSGTTPPWSRTRFPREWAGSSRRGTA